MIDPNHVPDISAAELLARYVLFSKHIRKDRTLKADAFMPSADDELSVMRHLMSNDKELWGVGSAVAKKSKRTLYGRGDIRAGHCTDQGLATIADPTSNNPNHAVLRDWPAEKSVRKNVAQELSEKAQFVAFEANTEANHDSPVSPRSGGTRSKVKTGCVIAALVILAAVVVWRIFR